MSISGPLCTRESLAADLREVGLSSGQTVLVHSSLSSLGWVVGGSVAVVQALLDVLGPTGNLVVPTHTPDNSDPAQWRNPSVPEQWWPAIRAAMPAYDPRITPCRKWMGAIPETVRTWPNAIRSQHPHTSFAALGPQAQKISAVHALDCELGELSPLAQLEKINARVLLMGVGFDSCTCFHLAEYRVPGPTQELSFAVMTENGREWLTVHDRAVDGDCFTKLGEDFERDSPVQHGTVGAAKTRLFSLRNAVSYAQQWLLQHRPYSD